MRANQLVYLAATVTFDNLSRSSIHFFTRRINRVQTKSAGMGKQELQYSCSQAFTAKLLANFVSYSITPYPG